MKTIVLDGTDIRPNGKGVSRSLVEIAARLTTDGTAGRYVVLASALGAQQLGHVVGDIEVVPPMSGVAWEQLGLARHARRLGASAVYTMRECGPPVRRRWVHHIHEDPAPRWARLPPSMRAQVQRRYAQLLFRRSLTTCARVLTSSATTADALSRRLSLPRSTISIVPLGVSDAFRGAPGGERSCVLHLGSEDPRDNTLDVLRAWFALAERRPLPPLVIAGDLGVLEPQARAILGNAPTQVEVILRGRVDDHQLAHLYRSAIVCVQPATDEGFGLQPLEAMAAGAAVLAYDTPAVRELVGDTARLLPARDPEALAVGVAELLDDEPARARLAVEGHRRAADFDWDQTAAMLDAALAAVVA